MLQINEETGTARSIARKLNISIDSKQTVTETQAQTSTQLLTVADNRLNNLKQKPKKYAEFVSSMFAILYAVYSSSAGPATKHKCLRALLRMIYYSSSEVSDQLKATKSRKSTEQKPQTNILYALLKNLPISSQIASLLASTDPKILVSALQMCEILMQKMPDIFSVYFLREGVIHQIDKLIESSAINLAVATTADSAVLPDDDQKTSPKSEPIEMTDENKTCSGQRKSSNLISNYGSLRIYHFVLKCRLKILFEKP